MAKCSSVEMRHREKGEERRAKGEERREAYHLPAEAGRNGYRRLLVRSQTLYQLSDGQGRLGIEPITPNEEAVGPIGIEPMINWLKASCFTN